MGVGLCVWGARVCDLCVGRLQSVGMGGARGVESGFVTMLIAASALLSSCLGRQSKEIAGTPAPRVDDTCHPESLGDWKPTWAPPTLPAPGACTQQQIERQFAVCASSKNDTTACNRFNNDPENVGCVGCLLSAPSAERRGPIVVGTPRGGSLVNTPGCIALVDGDTSAASCGAKKQAYLDCESAACSKVCPGSYRNSRFYRCGDEASLSICRQFLEAAQCSQSPRYSRCAYPSYGQFYLGIGKLWCTTGFQVGAQAP
jgi:hypothetical protein